MDGKEEPGFLFTEDDAAVCIRLFPVFIAFQIEFKMFFDLLNEKQTMLFLSMHLKRWQRGQTGV